MKFFFSSLILIIGLQAVALSGTIYDGNTDDVAKNIIVKFTGTNTYQIFSKDGFFSLNITPGNYSIYLADIENGTIVREGTEHVSLDFDSEIDLLIFPIENYSKDLNTSQIFNLPPQTPSVSPNTGESKQSGFSFTWFFLAFVVIIFLLVYYLKSKKTLVHTNLVLTGEEELIYNLIKKEKIVSQKELRKNVSFSEAKVSMILSSLEEKGVLKKVRKGNLNELEVIK